MIRAVRSPVPRRKAVRSRRQKPEEVLQRKCVLILENAIEKPPHGPFWTAINPVPAKSKAVAGISKAMGLRAGVPDLLLVFYGLPVCIEFKAGKGRLSKSQEEIWPELSAAGCALHEVRTVKEFLDVLDRYGIPICMETVEKIMGTRWLMGVAADGED